MDYGGCRETVGTYRGEALVGYAQRDLLVPALAEGGWADLGAGGAAARAWCAEVNGRAHSKIAAVGGQWSRDNLRALDLFFVQQAKGLRAPKLQRGAKQIRNRSREGKADPCL